MSTPRVQDYMSSVLHTVRPEDSIGSAFKKLAMNRIRHLLVVDEPGRLQGIITDRDIRLALPSLAFSPDLGELYLRLEDLKVHQVMTRDVCTTTPESPLAEAVDLCLRHRIGALPVLRDGALVGIITETDLLRAF
ncbi:MAG: CBS domain-containing protein, partial [candidate division NC10 bacterium]